MLVDKLGLFSFFDSSSLETVEVFLPKSFFLISSIMLVLRFLACNFGFLVSDFKQLLCPTDLSGFSRFFDFPLQVIAHSSN